MQYSRYLIEYTLLVENIEFNKKCYGGAWLQAAFCLGSTLLAITAYYIRNHIDLLTIMLIYNIIIFIVKKMYLSESSCWLESKGKYEKSKWLLKNMAKVNGKSENRKLIDH